VGTQTNYYYVIIKSAGASAGLFYAGKALTNGSGNVIVHWPAPILSSFPSVTFDVLVVVVPAGSQTSAPYPGNANSVATGLTFAGVCNTAGICTFTDPQSGTSVYSMLASTVQAHLSFWPGAFILSGGSNLYLTNCNQNGEFIATTLLPSIYCNGNFVGTSNSNGYNPYFASSMASDVTGAQLRLGSSQSGANTAGLKGFQNRLFFFGSINPTDLVTLVDSNPNKTLATAGYRPAWDINDVALGIDNPIGGLSSTSVYLRAPSAVSTYIGTLPDNLSFIERTTISKKEVRVNTQLDQNLAVLGNCVIGCGPFTLSGSQTQAPYPWPNGGSLGAGWTVTDGSWAVSNNNAVCSVGGDLKAMAANTSLTYANDQYSQTVVLNIGPVQAGPMVRASNAAETAYWFQGTGSGSALFKIVAGVLTGLGGGSGPAVSNGDVMGISVQGTTITGYLNGTAVLTTTDASIASGYPGLMCNGSGSQSFNLWRGGDLSSSGNQALSLANTFRITPVAFSALPACAAGTEGSMRAVNDSNTATWGATIAGSSTNHVLAFCDGTAWSVAAK
jgi:hypothetical protein